MRNYLRLIVSLIAAPAIATLIVATSSCGYVYAQDQDSAQAVATANNTTITIGVLIPLTGDFAFIGEMARQGVEIAIAQLNKTGQRVQVIYQDEKCLPKEALAGFKKLVTVDKVDQVLGPLCTGSILTVAQTANSMKRHFLALLDTNRAVAESGEFTYAIGYSSDEEAALVAEHARISGYNRLGVIYEEDAWAIGVKNAFIKKLKDLGGGVIAEESQVVIGASSAPDYKAVITKVMRHKPDALFVVPAYNGGFFIKQLRSMGHRIPVFGPDTFAVQDVIEVAKEAANGVVCANAEIDESSPRTIAFKAALAKSSDRKLDSIFYPGLGHDGVRFLFSVAQSGKPFPEAINEIDISGSVLGFPRFNSERQAKLSPKLFTIREQKLEPLLMNISR